jgi:hypothetical protein
LHEVLLSRIYKLSRTKTMDPKIPNVCLLSCIFFWDQ